MERLAFLASSFAFGLCSAGVAAQEPGNVLLVVMDDVGVSRVAAYGEHPDAGPTPVIDALAANGVLFRRAYGNPTCSPTRMTLLTGRYAFRTGVGTPYQWITLASYTPNAHELSLAEPVGAAGYRTGVVGKWHLCTSFWNPDPFLHPILVGGFDVHLGAMANLDSGASEDYFSWEKNVATAAGAFQHLSEHYATSESVDDALRLIERWDDAPWFLWLAFNAAHAPFHAPPPELHSLPVTEDSPKALLFRAAVESLDTELGRLLAEMPADVRARTTIIVVGDNGTPGAVMTPPMVSGHYKGTPYEGGIRVPLIVSGYGVEAPGREVEALVNTVDLFETIVALTGASSQGSAVDSVSLWPYLVDPVAPAQRRWVYSESFSPNGDGPYGNRDRAVRDERYKLIRRKETAVTEELYDLTLDPTEEHDLLPSPTAEEQAAYEVLVAVLDELKA